MSRGCRRRRGSSGRLPLPSSSCASVSTAHRLDNPADRTEPAPLMNSRTPRRLSLLLSSFALLGALHAQPSGGPYGPRPQTYEVPKGAGHVYYVAPDGKADAAGTSLD